MISEAINRETLSAFIVALSRQEHSASLQTQLHQIGQQIQDNPALLEQPIVLIQPLLDAYPNLNTAYLQAGLELEQKNVNRSKGGPIDFYKEASTAEITNVFKDVCGATDSFRRAQQQTQPSFWQKLWPSSK
jgi:hypothetical protein